MSKILLIQPSEERNMKKASGDPSMPLGLIYIGSMLKHHGHEVKILDRNLYPSNDLLKSLLKRDYAFVGIGSFTGEMLYDALDVPKIVKETSDSIVVWGSFHPTIVPKQTLENPFVDHIIQGEGEETFLKMVEVHEEGKNFSNLKGVDLNPLACPPDINKLPQIDYGLIEIDKYPHFFVSTSRGCPYRCTFCYNSYGNESVKPYRNLDEDKATKLIEAVVLKYKRKTFTIVDDNFPSDKERLKKICSKMSKFNIRFDTFCRANYADMETLSYLKKAGCWQIQIGIESGSQRILNFMKKGTTVKMNAEAIKNCRKAGIFSHTAFMIGIPTETVEDIKATERFIKINKPDLGGVGIFHPFPKTKLWDYCIERNLIKIPKTIEEWGTSYPPGFGAVKMNVSEIPDEVLVGYHTKLNKILNEGRYLKKALLYIKNGRIPDYRRILSVLKSKINPKN